MSTRTLIPLISMAAVLASAAPAGATTVFAGSGFADDYISIQAGKRERNDIVVTERRRDLLVVDRGAPIKMTKKSGCDRINARTVSCPNYSVAVHTGDMNDRITLNLKPLRNGDAIPSTPAGLGAVTYWEDSEASAPAGSSVNAGPGDDVIKGSPSDDDIDPGPGKDVVDLGGGQDYVDLYPDGRPDTLKGGAGMNTANLNGVKPLTADLRAGTVAWGNGEIDRISSFRRIHGGRGDDTLRGGDVGEALFGEAGNDTIDGGPGDDYLVGEESSYPKWSRNTLSGGAGNDLIDGRTPVAGTTYACGDGEDSVASASGAKLDATCESEALWLLDGELAKLDTQDWPPLWSGRVSVRPTSTQADGVSPVYTLTCPDAKSSEHGACSGTLTVERGGKALGSGTFSAEPGKSTQVPVTLTDAGKAALAAGPADTTVRISGALAAPKTGPADDTAPLDLDWQAVAGS